MGLSHSGSRPAKTARYSNRLGISFRQHRPAGCLHTDQARGKRDSNAMVEVLVAAVLTDAVFSIEVFSAGTVVSIRTTMDTAMSRTVIIRSTVRPPATDRVWLRS
jgi:hypothetical protein